MEVTPFQRAFERTVGHEGGYVNNPADPGGETKFGISKRSYPAEDIPNLTLERARQIYFRDFWNTTRCEYLPGFVSLELFDAAVNHGPKPAIRLVQRALRVTDDGVVGPVTIAAADAIHPAVFDARFNGERLMLYCALAGWPDFGRGWVRRVARNLLEVE